MDFVDTTLVRLADATTRAAVFDDTSLAQLVAASHDTAGLDVAAPFAAVFDELRFAYQDDRAITLNGSWMVLGHTDRTELALTGAGFGAAGPRVDALWTGSIAATSRGGDARVDKIDLTYRPSAPPIIDAALRVHYDNLAASTPPSQPTFGVAAALLVRPSPVSVAALLEETRRIRPYLDQLGFTRAADGARARRAPLAVWVLPSQVFDDAGWPGAGSAGSADQKRAERRSWAGAWLAREGIGLVVPPTN